jgi:hypothetical protein
MRNLNEEKESHRGSSGRGDVDSGIAGGLAAARGEAGSESKPQAAAASSSSNESDAFDANALWCAFPLPLFGSFPLVNDAALEARSPRPLQLVEEL